MADLSDPRWHIKDVACPASGECVAVGDKGGGASPVIEHLAEGQWSEAGLSPAGERGSLRGGECTAVGDSKPAPNTFPGAYAIHWDGSEWQMQEAVGPSVASWVELHDVSCASPSACTAVGRFGLQSGEIRPMALDWDGAEWSLQPVNAPAATPAWSPFPAPPPASAGQAATTGSARTPSRWCGGWSDELSLRGVITYRYVSALNRKGTY